MIKPTHVFVLLIIICSAVSCKGKKAAQEIKEPTTTFIIKKDTALPTKDGSPVRPPIVNISDSIAIKYTVLYMKDSAASSDRISQKLAKIYGTLLPEAIKKQQLKITGAHIAWYKTNKAPFFFEAGLPVNKKPSKLPKGVFVKTIGGGNAVTAHFYGPYSITHMGYDALADYIKDNKKKRNGTPYEIYVTEPIGKDGKAIDPYKVQTDIVFPYQ
ncbi:MAG TPA: GyrI-like domain-containing protein [Ferruginibacter sp.]|nr:GyrI-like domain-containing protein [Ferruginibacter sp.]